MKTFYLLLKYLLFLGVLKIYGQEIQVPQISSPESNLYQFLEENNVFPILTFRGKPKKATRVVTYFEDDEETINTYYYNYNTSGKLTKYTSTVEFDDVTLTMFAPVNYLPYPKNDTIITLDKTKYTFKNNKLKSVVYLDNNYTIGVDSIAFTYKEDLLLSRKRFKRVIHFSTDSNTQEDFVNISDYQLTSFEKAIYKANILYSKVFFYYKNQEEKTAVTKQSYMYYYTDNKVLAGFDKTTTFFEPETLENVINKEFTYNKTPVKEKTKSNTSIKYDKKGRILEIKTNNIKKYILAYNDEKRTKKITQFLKIHHLPGKLITNIQYDAFKNLIYVVYYTEVHNQLKLKSAFKTSIIYYK